jgi:hypothetical protein
MEIHMTDHTDSNETNPSGQTRAEELRARFAAGRAAEVTPVAAPEPPHPVRLARPGTVPEPESVAAPEPEPGPEEPPPAEEYDYDGPPGGYVPPGLWGADPFAATPENELDTSDFVGDRAWLDQETGSYLSIELGNPAPVKLPENEEWEVDGYHYNMLLWKEHEIIDRKPYGHGLAKPRRETLEPEPPKKGRDPWADTGYLYLTSAKTGRQITLYGSADSLRRAIGAVIKEIRLMRDHVKRSEGDAATVVKLIRLKSQQRHSTKYDSDYRVPVFEHVKWHRPGGSPHDAPKAIR